MKQTIRIVSKRFPKHGRFIGEGSYEYFLTPDGLPAMGFRWQGLLLPGSKATFVFPRDTLKIGYISDDAAKSQTRWAGFSGASTRTAGGGPIVSLLYGALGAATARTNNIKGFGVFYNNEDGHPGLFFAVAEPDIVDEIFRSIPPERQEHDAPPVDPPTT